MNNEDTFFENDTQPELDDEQNVESASQDDERNDPLYQVNRLLGYLDDIFENASTVPLSNKRIVNAEMGMRIVDNIQTCLPHAIQQAEQILENRDRIIHDADVEADAMTRAARARADAAIKDATQAAQQSIHEAEDKAKEIIEQAENRARAMVEQSEIMRHAHEEATQLLNDTRLEVNQQKSEANQYVEDLLHELEHDVQATLAAVQTSVKNFSGQ